MEYTLFKEQSKKRTQDPRSWLLGEQTVQDGVKGRWLWEGNIQGKKMESIHYLIHLTIWEKLLTGIYWIQQGK